MRKGHVLFGLMVLSNAVLVVVLTIGIATGVPVGGRQFLPWFSALGAVTCAQNAAWARRRDRRRRIATYGTADQPPLLPYDGTAAASDPRAAPAGSAHEPGLGTT